MVQYHATTIFIIKKLDHIDSKSLQRKVQFLCYDKGTHTSWKETIGGHSLLKKNDTWSTENPAP